MKIKRIAHIGVAVKDADASKLLYQEMLYPPGKSGGTVRGIEDRLCPGGTDQCGTGSVHRP